MAEDIIKIPRKLILGGVISENLKSLRKKHSITQDELSKISGINRVTIAKYESCERLISLDNLLILAKALGESPSAILDGWEASL